LIRGDQTFESPNVRAFRPTLAASAASRIMGKGFIALPSKLDGKEVVSGIDMQNCLGVRNEKIASSSPATSTKLSGFGPSNKKK
jgi:hypothetical protein